MSWPASDVVVALVFVGTYVGMAIGRIPGLAIDRTGLTLSALIVLLIAGIQPLDQLADTLELPTLLLLFALMLVIAAGGLLSAVLVNDIVVFAFTPMLCIGLRQRGLDPRPYLLGLAGAANAGSAATLIGNPQNILIGQVGGLGFFAYARIAVIPAIVALLVIYAVIAWVWRAALRHGERVRAGEPPLFDRWLGGKSLMAIVALIALLASFDHRAIAALAIAGVLLWSRRLSTRSLLGEVDWPLLVMIGSLFAITGAATALPAAAQLPDWLAGHGLLPFDLGPLALFSVLASNTIGNVPAVVLLLKAVPDIPAPVLYGLALFSTLAGNLLLTGSLANIIVAERSAQCDVRLGFGDFARVGIPIALVSMSFAAAWLWALGVLA